jgi:hypothetical protein
MKRGLVISFRCSPADTAAAERCRRQIGGPFGPTASTLMLLIFRYGLTQILQGHVTAEKLAKFAETDLETI